MARIVALSIKNFRGLKEFYHDFSDSKLFCLVGRGNSGKSTILEAISLVLSPSWKLNFYDSDFYNCDITQQIEISVFLGDLSDEMIREDKFGLFMQFYNKETKIFSNQPKEGLETVLELKLLVDKNLEPVWSVSKEDRNEEMKSSDRSKIGVHLIADNLDTHFTWKRSSPLKSILRSKKIDSIQDSEENLFLTATRQAKKEIDGIDFPLLTEITNDITSTAKQFGAHHVPLDTTIDIKNILFDETATALHNNNIPIRLMGKGSKKILSIAVQLQLIKEKGILLIDEIEQGLEPDRVQHLVSTFKTLESGQIFISTHSRDVLVELSSSDILLMKEGSSSLISFDNTFQGTIRKNPEALFAKFLIICEGATEVGFMRYLNRYRIKSGKGNISTKGIRIVDGQGNEMETYVKKFSETHEKLCLFCDSDESNLNSKKDSFKELGVEIIDCDDGNSLENQIFMDLPWEGIKQLIAYQIKKSSREQVEASLKSKIEGDLPANWFDNDDANIRSNLGNIAKKKGWFKRIDHSEFLAEVCIKNLKIIEDSTLHTQIQNLEYWIDHA